MEDLNVEKFIQAVKRKEILWDLCHPLYKNNKVKAQEWMIISDDFRVPCEAAKRKWKGLRDSYNRYIGKKNVSGQGADELETVWKYADSMEFLKEHLKPKITTSSHTLTSVEDNCYEIASSSLPVTPDARGSEFKFSPLPTVCSLEQAGEPSCSSTSSSSRRMSDSPLCEEPAKKKQKTNQTLESELISTLKSVNAFLSKPRVEVPVSPTGTEDELYCRSLLATLKTFPPDLRDEAKIGIMRYLADFKKQNIYKQN